jgi:hypothetical protein
VLSQRNDRYRHDFDPRLRPNWPARGRWRLNRWPSQRNTKSCSFGSVLVNETACEAGTCTSRTLPNFRRVWSNRPHRANERSMGLVKLQGRGHDSTSLESASAIAR